MKLIKSENKKLFYILAIILGGIFIFLCTYNVANVQKEHINWSDEARHGINAYEMLKNKNFIVTTYGEKIDYWNLKPPLSEYFIILGYKIFGYNVVGLRAYSIISVILCCFLCFLYAYKKIGKKAALYVLAAFSATSLIFSYHWGRAGDADSLFILFYTLSVLALCCNKKGFKGVYLACLCFAFAFLTKSFHAGIIAINVIIYLLINKLIKIKYLKQLICCFILACFPILLWGILRYQYDGFTFLKKMFEYDLFTRSTSVIENHPGGPFYYFQYVFLNQISFIFIFLAALIIIKIKNKSTKKILLILVLSILNPLIIFSLVKTKIIHYVYCIFPPLIILSAYGFNEIFTLKNNYKYFFLSFIIIFSFANIIFNIQMILDLPNDYQLRTKAFSILNRNAEYNNQKIYVYLDEAKEDDINQDLFLALELAGDLKPKNGGYKAWNNSPNSYLFIEKENLDKISDYKIIETSANYYLLKHSSFKN